MAEPLGCFPVGNFPFPAVPVAPNSIDVCSVSQTSGNSTQKGVFYPFPAFFQEEHEEEGHVHLSLQRGLPHHQGQPAALPGLPAQALRGHRNDEGM